MKYGLEMIEDVQCNRILYGDQKSEHSGKNYSIVRQTKEKIHRVQQISIAMRLEKIACQGFEFHI